MKNFPILVVLFSGCFAFEGKNIIIFPKQTTTDHVILKPIVKQPLKQLTVCLRSYTDLSREYALFSMASPGSAKDNTFLITVTPPTTCTIYVHQEDINFKVAPDLLAWRHTCVSWDSDTGLLQLWINGKRHPRKGVRKGAPIGAEMNVILGQDQDNYGGGFDPGQSLVGEICDVHMWDYVLSPESIKSFSYDDSNIPGNIFSWRNGTIEMKGGAILKENEVIVYD